MEMIYRIFPIAHKYDMQLIIGRCVKSFDRSYLLELLKYQPMASSEVLKRQGLIQILALADAKQCEPLVQACLSKLVDPDSSDETVRDALTSPHYAPFMDGLRPETYRMIIRRMVGLPEDFKASYQNTSFKIICTFNSFEIMNGIYLIGYMYMCRLRSRICSECAHSCQNASIPRTGALLSALISPCLTSWRSFHATDSKPLCGTWSVIVAWECWRGIPPVSLTLH